MRTGLWARLLSASVLLQSGSGRGRSQLAPQRLPAQECTYPTCKLATSHADRFVGAAAFGLRAAAVRQRPRARQLAPERLPARIQAQDSVNLKYYSNVEY